MLTKYNYKGLHTRTWEDLYMRGEKWEDELRFCKDELKFLQDLVSNYFLALTSNQELKEVHNVSNNLTSLNMRSSDLSAKIKQHLITISSLMEEVFKDEDILDNHMKLQKFIHTYMKDVRKTKRHLFDLVEKVLKGDKFQHLLSAW